MLYHVQVKVAKITPAVEENTFAPVVEETPSKDSKGSRFGDSSSDGSHFAGSTGSKRRRKRVHDALLQELEAVKMTPAL